MVKNNENKSLLWELLRKGDDNAFKLLYDQYAKLLYQYGLKLTSQEQIIEDCIHDLFIKIYNKKRKLSNTNNVKLYLVKSFRNNLVRMLEREKKYSLKGKGDYYFELAFSIESKIVDSESEQKKKDILIKALKKLSARQKESIFLRYTNGLEYHEIAGIMGMSVQACRNSIYRAIKLLRGEFKKSSINLLSIFLEYS